MWIIYQRKSPKYKWDVVVRYANGNNIKYLTRDHVNRIKNWLHMMPDWKDGEVAYRQENNRSDHTSLPKNSVMEEVIKVND